MLFFYLFILYLSGATKHLLLNYCWTAKQNQSTCQQFTGSDVIIRFWGDRTIKFLQIFLGILGPSYLPSKRIVWAIAGVSHSESKHSNSICQQLAVHDTNTLQVIISGIKINSHPVAKVTRFWTGPPNFWVKFRRTYRKYFGLIRLLGNIYWSHK